jgi:3-oxoacyl-[acyl-carrier-protein] synthase II
LTMNRVVITGIGAVTPLGNTFRDSWEAALAGRSGIRPISRLDTSGIPWKVAGELKSFDPREFLGTKELKRLDPFAQYAVAASLMAAEDAGLIGRRESPSLASGGVVIGSSRGGISTLEKELLRMRASKYSTRDARLSAYLMPSTTVGMAPSYVALKLGIKGHCLGISNACASGSNAIGEAYNLIKMGHKGPFLAGGAEAPVCGLCIRGYGASGALSKIPDSTASRPFDMRRDGFVVAEGACIMVLERLESALERGAKAYGEIIGYANTADAFHQTRPDSVGEAEAIRSALALSGSFPEDIDYINTHGTSTPLGDTAEASAINAVFGERAGAIPVSALKSMTGHMLAASGALETAFTLMSMKEGIIPPTLNYALSDPGCAVSVTTEKTAGKIRTGLSCSFGFGGVNAVLVLKGME